MIARGLFVLSVLTSCVVSLPVTPSQLENENEDVEVMKCIVEALADVLSRPHPVPVSEECLVTLKTDDRLVSVLRRHNLLKLLQDIAVRGHQERAAATPEPTTRTPQAAEGDADQSMLEALGGPGERSILSQKEREGEKDDSVGDGESRDAAATAKEEEEVKEEEQQEEEERDENPGSRGSASVEEGSEAKADKRGEEEEEEEENHEEKRAHLHDEHMIKDKKGARSGEEGDAPRIKSKKKFVEEGEEEEEEEEEEEDKRSAYFSHGLKPEGEEEEEEEVAGEMKRDSHTRWTKRGKSSPGGKKKPVGEEAPHHSKEGEEKEEEEKKGHAQRSPEEKELRMIAGGGGPEERRGAEEEGSASRKPEEPGIESLAAIESELESVAQKLHEMRRG